MMMMSGAGGQPLSMNPGMLMMNIGNGAGQQPGQSQFATNVQGGM